MKYLLPLLVFLSGAAAFAINVKIYGPCSESPVFQAEENVDARTSLGAFSVQVFEKYDIPYIGSELGFNSIINTPTDRKSIEIVSKTELRAYGWCYSVDGKVPEQMPHEIFFTPESTGLVWFYSYSTYKNDQWQDDYCTPAYHVKAPQFCGNK